MHYSSPSHPSFDRFEKEKRRANSTPNCRIRLRHIQPLDFNEFVFVFLFFVFIFVFRFSMLLLLFLCTLCIVNADDKRAYFCFIEMNWTPKMLETPCNFNRFCVGFLSLCKIALVFVDNFAFELKKKKRNINDKKSSARERGCERKRDISHFCSHEKFTSVE